MKVKTSWIGIVLTGVLGALLAVANGDIGLRGVQLGNCVLDLRPYADPETQVYWKEYSVPAENLWGAEFEMDVSRSNQVIVGGAVVTSGQTYDGQPHQQLKIRVTYDADNGNAKWGFSTDNGSTWTEYTNTVWGQYDSLGSFVEPQTESVESGSANKERERIFVQYKGMKLGFTLTDY